ncbi:hypothetical protein, partial [Xanthomonas sacchari]|uniref:hypothetical protein n=1 Tax=Xanthomonas sacchari TaxID=56458 RepID=UPI00225E0D3E
MVDDEGVSVDFQYSRSGSVLNDGRAVALHFGETAVAMPVMLSSTGRVRSDMHAEHMADRAAGEHR